MVQQRTAKAKGSLPLLGSCSSNTSHACVYGFKTFPTWQCQRLYQMDLSNISARPPGKDPGLPRSFSTFLIKLIISPAFLVQTPLPSFSLLAPALDCPGLPLHTQTWLCLPSTDTSGLSWRPQRMISPHEFCWIGAAQHRIPAFTDLQFAVLSSLMGTKQRGEGEAAMHQCPGQGNHLGGDSASNWVTIVLGSHPRISAQEHKAHRPSLVSSDGRAPPAPLAAFSRKQRLRDGCGWILPEVWGECSRKSGILASSTMLNIALTPSHVPSHPSGRMLLRRRSTRQHKLHSLA